MTAKTLAWTLADLRAAGARQRRAPRADLASGLARLTSACNLLSVEVRDGGVAFRLAGETERRAAFQLTCVLHSAEATPLTAAERAVAELLCEGRTRAQIAKLRGVTANTVKSQVRQVFRKLNVDSRVALVRRWCP